MKIVILIKLLERFQELPLVLAGLSFQTESHHLGKKYFSFSFYLFITDLS